MASSKTESVPLSSLVNSSTKVEMEPPPGDNDECKDPTLGFSDSTPDGEDVVEGRNALGSNDNSSTHNDTRIDMDSPPDGEDFVEGRNTLGDDDTDSSSKSGPTNKFQSRREVTKGLYDVALLMANVSQLKSVLDSEDNRYYTTLVCLLSFSISLHLVSAILLYVLLIIEKQTKNKLQHDSLRINKKEGNQKQQSTLKQTPATESGKTAVCPNCFAVTPCCRCWQIYKIDIIATLCVFGVTIINIFITAFYSSVKK